MKNRRHNSEYIYGLCLLVSSIVCAIIKPILKSNEFNFSIKNTLRIIYSIPLCAFLLLAFAILPACVINAITPLRNMPEFIKIVLTLIIASSGLLVLT